MRYSLFHFLIVATGAVVLAALVGNWYQVAGIRGAAIASIGLGSAVSLSAAIAYATSPKRLLLPSRHVYATVFLFLVGALLGQITGIFVQAALWHPTEVPGRHATFGINFALIFSASSAVAAASVHAVRQRNCRHAAAAPMPASESS